MKKILFVIIGCTATLVPTYAQSSFTPGNLVVLQTSGTLSKASSPVTLQEYSTTGTAGMTVNIPNSGTNPFQTSGVFGGSEGFLTTATNGKYLILAGYKTSGTITDITTTASSQVTRVIGKVAPSGFYLQTDSSTAFFSANDIRGAVSDGTNYWAAGASNASIDGIDYFGPGTPTALAGGTVPAKAYAMHIFNGQIYYSTQKAGPSNTSSQLGIFTLGSGLPTSGTISPTQVINMGTIIPQDFSMNASGTVCYIAVSLNTAAGGIQKWTLSGTTWSLAYTLGTGIVNIGAYGLVVDYSGSVPALYATTFDAAGNRVVKILDNGTLATANISTIVAATSNTYFKGIAFAPVASGTPEVNLSISTDTASESGVSRIIVKANSSAPVSSTQTVNLSVSGTGITSGDYNLTSPTITIANGATYGVDTFTVVDDLLMEGTETAMLKISGASSGIIIGVDSIKSISIADNDAPAPPTIILNTDSTSNYIDGGVSTAPVSPLKVSGVILDPTDPVANQGLAFNIATNIVSASLSISATSSDTTIVPNSHITISGTGGLRFVKINPIRIGYSNITVTVTDGTYSTNFVIAFAASAASSQLTRTFWHTGMSDGSDAIALDDNFYVSGDDELNVLNVYNRKQSGLPLISYNYSSNLALPDPAKPEADIEAATRSFLNPTKVFWAGSMSNGKAPYDNKPNRDRIFATIISGTGLATSFSFSGWANLRSSVLAWGDSNGYNFTASAAAGVDSKAPDGYALEGMVFGPDSTTLYLGFRAPLVPTTTRKKAVIAPIKNFETWFNNGTQTGNPIIGAPIELDLGVRGIRDLTRLSNGTYIIIAGNPGSAQTGAVYKWSGNETDAPIRMINPAVDTLNMEGVMQVNTSGQTDLTQLQIITDMGGNVLYNDAVEAKDFGDLILRKFRSDIASFSDLTLHLGVKNSTKSFGTISIYPNASKGPVHICFESQTVSAYTLRITDLSGNIILEKSDYSNVGKNLINIDLARFSKGNYLLQLLGNSFHYNQPLVLE